MVRKNSLSVLQQLRLDYQPPLPKSLQSLKQLTAVQHSTPILLDPRLERFFPHLSKQGELTFTTGDATHTPKRVGVLFSGGQAAGGHNVLTGLYDALQKLHPKSTLFGFLDGPQGILNKKYIPLTAEKLSLYRNQGGFDCIGSSRTKIETAEQFQAATQTVTELKLDGLVVIGGDDSNTIAALLTEHFLSQNVPCTVVGVPKTIDGDLKGREVELSFGFDTASKIYSEIIGNIQQDTLSAKKSYYFIKVMGRSASHLVLECALKTHPNIALIGEEVAAQQMTLQQVVHQLCELICTRATQGKDYGVILIPEGIIEFMPDVKQLLRELNKLQSRNGFNADQLSSASAACWQLLPTDIQQQLLLDRDPHGNVQVSKIETDRLFIKLVQKELKKRKEASHYKGKFSAQAIFCGYEGRSGLPSNFDANYGYALGHVAALLVTYGATGYIAALQHLIKPVADWEPVGCHLASLMTLEERQGKEKPVIAKAFVDLQGKPFEAFKKERARWMTEDAYCSPGPIQFFGPSQVVDTIPLTLHYECSATS